MGFFSFLLIFFTFILFCFAWGARTLRAREGDCIINSLRDNHKFFSKWAATFHHTGSTRAVSPPRRDPRCWSTGEETSCHVHKDPRTAHNGRFHAQPAMKDLQQHASKEGSLYRRYGTMISPQQPWFLRKSATIEGPTKHPDFDSHRPHHPEGISSTHHSIFLEGMAAS